MKRKSRWNRIWGEAGTRLASDKGMTMAEMLIVVAIVIVLSGVGYVAVGRYQRSMGQLERDGIAKQIFVAAQNHLTEAQGEGFLGKRKYGTQGTYDDDGNDGNGVFDQANGVYYYVVNSGAVSRDGEEAFRLMLPFGAIDETVRAGGSYLIRYQPKTGRVLDVFYCSTFGNPKQFNHVLSVDDYEALMALSGPDHKMERRNYDNGSILGWYGGGEVDTVPTLTLENPTISVVNEDQLYVMVNDSDMNPANRHSLRLILTGELSHAMKYYTLCTSSSNSGETTEESNRVEDGTTYKVILDDITAEGLHFFEIVPDTEEKFIPGENITVQAVAYSVEEFSNIAYSTVRSANSLFADDSSPTQARIASIRHLENLDRDISLQDANDDI